MVHRQPFANLIPALSLLESHQITQHVHTGLARIIFNSELDNL